MSRTPSSPGGSSGGARAHLERGQRLLQSGRLDAAAEAFERVLQRRRTHGEAALGLARVRAAQGRLADAAAVLEPAAEAALDDARIQLVLADLRYQDGDAAGALDAAVRAAAAAPAEPAAPRLEAGSLLRLNRVDDAADAVKRAAALAPGDPQVLRLEAMVAARRRDHATALDRVDRALTGLDPRAGVLRAELLHLGGFALDALGRQREAFERFAAAGALDERIAAAKRIDPGFAQRLVATCRRGYTPEVLARRPFDPAADQPAPGESGSRRLAFLVGFPRSGTTMTEQVLAAHPNVVTSDEEPLLRPVRDALAGSRVNVDRLPERLAALTAAEIAELRATYWAEVDRCVPDADPESLFVDKFPLNLNHVGLINAVFPDARVLVALRDPRDVCLSCFMQDFPLNTGTLQCTRLDRTVQFYAAVMDLWLHVRPHVAVPWIEIRYEDTVADLPGVARRVLEHLGLPWHDAVLAFHERARERLIRTPSAVAVTEPVHARAVGRWQPYAEAFAPLQPLLARFVSEWGYEPA